MRKQVTPERCDRLRRANEIGLDSGRDYVGTMQWLCRAGFHLLRQRCHGLDDKHIALYSPSREDRESMFWSDIVPSLYTRETPAHALFAES
jgi:hypothetical protein